MDHPSDNKETLEKQAPGVENDISPEYVEYVELSTSFQGPRLRQLIRKVDLRVMPQLVILYLLAYIDRSNVGNAKLFSAEEDLGVSGKQWNIALGIFYIPYSVTGPWANVALKRVGPRLWLPTLLLACGIVNVCAGLQSTFGGWVAFRFLLGLCESGVFPGCSFVMSNWYSKREIQTRMALFFAAASASGAFSGILAYGIGQLDGTWGYHGWRFIYCIEGVFTVLAGLSAYWIILNDPGKTGSWLAPDETRFLVLRRSFALGGENAVAETEGFQWKYARQALTSFHTYSIGFIEFAQNTAIVGISFTLPTIIYNMGFSASTSQAMTVPPYVFACIMTIAFGWFSDRSQKRMLAVVIPNSIAFLGYIVVIVSVRYPHLTGVQLFGVFLVAGGLYPTTPATTAWISLNSAGSMKRGVAIGGTFMIANWGSIVGSNIYLANEAPRYPTGFGVSLAFIALIAVLWPITYSVILRRINRKRDTMSEEALARHSPAEYAEVGDRSPLFRYST